MSTNFSMDKFCEKSWNLHIFWQIYQTIIILVIFQNLVLNLNFFLEFYLNWRWLTFIFQKQFLKIRLLVDFFLKINFYLQMPPNPHSRRSRKKQKNCILVWLQILHVQSTKTLSFWRAFPFVSARWQNKTYPANEWTLGLIHTLYRPKNICIYKWSILNSAL